MFQEVAIARNHVFLCGDLIIPGDVLEAGLMIFASTAISKLIQFYQGKIIVNEIVDMGLEAEDYHRILPTSVWYRAGLRANHRITLFEVVGDFTRTDAGFKDARDIIFAAWGFLDPKDYDFQPDYTASTRDVFVNASKAIFDAAGQSVLSLCYDCEANTTPNLPSWCPDWSLTQQSSRFVSPNHTFRRQIEHSFTSNENGDVVLSVQGLHLDTIHYVSDIYKENARTSMKDYGSYLSAEEKEEKEDSMVILLNQFLPSWRYLAALVRKLYFDLSNQRLQHSSDSLIPALFRCLDDDECTKARADAFKCLISRDPVEASILFCLPSEASSLEVCDVCTQGSPFTSRLEALFCEHLPVLYNSPDAESFDDLFVTSSFQTFVGGKSVSG
jgi:hypothetical protein